MSNKSPIQYDALQNACGCCEGVSTQSPIAIHNRPGLAVIAYRIGTHHQILASLQARLSSRDFPALAKLRTRDRDDFSIALLDAYACMMDVLSFYQERVANESYLRAAGERLSLSELARLIGYRLKPGVAAKTCLAFTLEEPPLQAIDNGPRQASGVPDKVTIPIGIKVQSVPGSEENPQTFETVESIEARPEWNVFKARTHEMAILKLETQVIYLKGTANQLKAGDALLFVGSERWDFRRIQNIELDSVANHTIVTLERGLSSVSPSTEPAANPKVYALRLRAALFGHNAPDWRVMSYQVKRSYLGLPARAAITDMQWPDFTIKDISNSSTSPDLYTLHLDTVYPQIISDSWLVLSIPEYQELYRVVTVGEDVRAGFMLVSKTTRLTISGENLSKFNERLRETAVLAQSELLELAEEPITPNYVEGDSLRIDRRVEGLEPGRLLILSGVTTDGLEDSEVLTLLKTEPDGDASKLFFTIPLRNSYRRDSVRIYANVARATHGETVQQILGSGAAYKTHQQFTLSHAPLTYTSADNETGAEAALEVRVNDILWHEMSTLFVARANDASYVVRIDEDGAGTIQFGDGRRGARLPTGQENVRAVYRKGIGAAGNLRPGQLSQLMTRPLGLKAVSNPIAAEGGVDADSTDHARRNIPLGVRTLGRVVSLRDYEDFARAYTGIAKAQAAVLDTRAGRTIVITVAGDDGKPPPEGTLAKLRNALKQNGDPLVHCEVVGYQTATTFRLAMRIKCHPDHARDVVLQRVEAALRTAFSFDARDFGQMVARSEVIAVVQALDGVMGVDLDRFYRDTVPGLEERLIPGAATVDGLGNAVAAELLLLAEAKPFDYLEEMS
ncbi:putative baseplate assembly protein [Nitrosomonas sp.]|uniref:putative baseplate assembly protein n=1 Tax=Nitrosomonas sp. TaxID=42353 RepID=UPI0037C6956A